MSELKVDKITPRLGTTLTLGDTGDTINFGSGVLPNFENLTVTGDLTVDTNSLKVDSTNNFVGIGTATPSVALDVVGAITATGNITGTLATASQPNITSVGTLTSATVSGDLTVDTNTLFVDASANTVGIGETSPSSKLHIKSSDVGAFTPFVGGDDLIIEGSEAGIGFMVGTADASNISFGDTANAKAGRINYDHSTDAMRFFTNDSEKMRIASNGRVGIGTSSPERLLHLQSGAPEIMMKDSDDNSYNTILSNGGVLSFSTGNTEAVRIDSSGKVGIGTSSPSTPLTLDIGTNNVGLFQNSTDATSGIALADNGGSINLATTSSGAFRVLVGGDANTPADNSSEAMRIDNSGNVVIGSGGLDTSGIGGTFTALNIRAGSGYPAIYGQTTATTTNKTALNLIGATSGASAGGAAEMLGAMEIACESDSSTNATGFMRFYTGSGGGLSERMRLTSSGNFLYGKTTTDVATAGIRFIPGGRIFVTRDNDPTAYFRRNTSVGNIMEFNQAGTSIGYIGSYTGSGVSQFFVSGADTGFKFNSTVDVIAPSNATGGDRNNQIDFGASANAWKDGYFGGTVTANAFSGDGSALTGINATGVTASSYGSSNKTNGYVRFTDGLIIQWGWVSSSGGWTIKTITLPLTFPNYVYSITTALDHNTGYRTNYHAMASIVSTSQIKVGVDDTTTSGTFWMVIGK